jgi:hypothetical protein
MSRAPSRTRVRSLPCVDWRDWLAGDPLVADLDARLADAGFARAPSVRAHLKPDGVVTVRFVWRNKALGTRVAVARRTAFTPASLGRVA